MLQNIRLSGKWIWVLGAWLIAGCMKGEIPVPRHEAGNLKVASVDMDPTYKYQVYYSLHEQRIVCKTLKTAWDIALEASREGWHIRLNTAKSMFALAVGTSDFSAVSAADTAGFALKKHWDAANGAADSTAVADWRQTRPVYIVDRGYDEMGAPQGFVKMQILTADTAGYRVRFASLAGGGDTTITVAKDTAYNSVFLSFTSRCAVLAEPPKAQWDIVFTQYTHIFYNEQPPTPYLVTGCLINSYNTAAIADTGATFGDVDWDAASKYTLSVHADVIGYSWKTYNGAAYEINSNITYIIRDARNIHYKLRFTGFYNSSGQKGAPRWEYAVL